MMVGSIPTRRYQVQNQQHLQQLTERQKRRQKDCAKFDHFFNTLVCQICGHNKKHHLELHHVDPSTKVSEVSRMIRDGCAYTKIVEEIEKCVALCSYCHKDVHLGLHNNRKFTLLKYFSVDTKKEILDGTNTSEDNNETTNPPHNNT